MDDVEYEADDEREDVPWMKGMVKEGEAPNEGQRNEVSRSSWMTKTRRKTAISALRKKVVLQGYQDTRTMSLATKPQSTPRRVEQGEQRLSELRGETMVNRWTVTSLNAPTEPSPSGRQRECCGVARNKEMGGIHRDHDFS